MHSSLLTCLCPSRRSQGQEAFLTFPEKDQKSRLILGDRLATRNVPAGPLWKDGSTWSHETQCLNPRETYSVVISGGGWTSLIGSDAVETIASFWEDGALRLGPCHGECRAVCVGCELGFSRGLSAVSCVLLDAASRRLESLIDKPEDWGTLESTGFPRLQGVLILESVES